eukprot:6194861-Pyramimonas_sp.AAC.1
MVGFTLKRPCRAAQPAKKTCRRIRAGREATTMARAGRVEESRNKRKGRRCAPKATGTGRRPSQSG